MSLDALFGKTLTLAQRAMDLRSTHHNRLVSNAVNMDTPGYQPFNTLIDAQLAGLAGSKNPPALARTHSAHLDAPTAAGAGGPPLAGQTGDSPFGRRMDRNTVDLERNMAELQENQIVYNALAQIVSRKFHSLREAIKGGMG